MEMITAELQIVVFEHMTTTALVISSNGVPRDEIEADFNAAIASQQDVKVEAELDDARASFSDASVDLTGANSVILARCRRQPRKTRNTRK